MRMHPVPMVKSPLRFASHIPEPTYSTLNLLRTQGLGNRALYETGSSSLPHAAPAIATITTWVCADAIASSEPFPLSPSILSPPSSLFSYLQKIPVNAPPAHAQPARATLAAPAACACPGPGAEDYQMWKPAHVAVPYTHQTGLPVMRARPRANMSEA
ncbi:hypothetical protein C8Q76DRAFT_852934 [Earliella scabrosa]|nr:hypothetical protein C8Q76DRAFT_852934 [Earliella scabrosa]